VIDHDPRGEPGSPRPFEQLFYILAAILLYAAILAGHLWLYYLFAQPIPTLAP
jgi:hypothetical protein